MKLPECLRPMIDQDQWVIWKSEDGSKVPYQAKAPSRRASSKDPSTWSTYRKAAAAGGDGVGFVLRGSGIAALDLDDCRNDKTGVLDDWAQDIVDRANGAYVEVTPSKKGVRVLGRARGEEVHTSRPMGRGKVEIYRDADRYITVSGQQIGDCSKLSNIDRLVDELTATPTAVEKDRSRSGVFHKKVCELAEKGWSVDRIEKQITDHPRMWDCAAKYTATGKLRQEIERSHGKATAGGKVEDYDNRIARLAQERFRPLSEVESRAIDWLWPGFLPFNMATVCDGYPDVGKSYLAIHIAAVGSKGGELPGGPPVDQFRSLIMTTENRAEFVLKPRFEAMGGDSDWVHYDKTGAPLDDEGFEVLLHKVKEFRPKFVLIDPLLAYVPPGVNMYHPNVIRPFLNRLDNMINECDAALMLIRHPIKTKRDNPLYQGAGGVDIIGVARSGFLVAAHPDDEELRVVMPLKHNVFGATKPQTFDLSTMRTVKSIGKRLPILKWKGETNITVEEVLNAKVADRSKALQSAIDWLRDYLKDGPQPVMAVMNAADAHAIVEVTLRRAKERLNVKSFKNKGEGGEWYWSLPTGVKSTNEQE